MPTAVRVLVVEDDELVRMVAVDFLREAGFVVTEVQDGDHAARLLIDPGGYHALFTDVRMPGVTDGVDVALHARRLDPRIPVLVASGYAKDLLSRLDGLNPPIEFYSKPYRAEQIIATLRHFTAHLRD
jgi:two-component system, response regulator PdtaR